MTPPTIILDGRPVVGQCLSSPHKTSGGEEAISTEAIIGKLRGANQAEVEKTLDYIIQNGFCNPRFIQPLLDLLSSNDSKIFGKALSTLMLMRENGVPFTPTQEEVFTKRLNGAQIQFVNGGLKITGKGVRLPNGSVLDEGSICFKDGRWFVAEGDSAVISGVRITNEDSGIKWRVDIFFDGKEHQDSETYVSFDVNQGKLTMASKAEYRGAVISLGVDNPFVPIDNSDDVKIEAERGMILTVESRIKSGLIPKITIKTLNGEGYATINNGWIQAGIAAKGIVSLGLGRGGSHNLASQSVTTAPFEVVLVDGSGTPKMLEANTSNALDTRYGGAEKVAGTGYRLIFNNYFEVGLLDLGQETRAKFIDGFVPFQIDTTLSGNTREYTIEDFHALYPNVRLSGYIDSTNIKLAMDYLQSLPPKVRESIKGVEFPEKWDSAGDAYATHDGIIHLKRNTFNMPLFQHECAHILTFQYEKMLDERIKAKLGEAGIEGFPIMVSIKSAGPNGSRISSVAYLVSYEGDNLRIEYIPWNDKDGQELKTFEHIARIYGVPIVDAGDAKKILIPLKQLKDKGLARKATKVSKILATAVFDNIAHIRSAIRITSETTADSFVGRWKSIAGDIYGKYVGTDTEYNINPGWTDNGIDDGPRHGCVRSYGAKNFYEDVATFVEQIWKNPEFFRPLVDPKSASYDPRYKQKLDLLLEYGFITREQYDVAVGTPAKKIDAVK